ncbi:GNAT family N-acetyltransferase [Colwelliaceae bacterium 6441]
MKIISPQNLNDHIPLLSQLLINCVDVDASLGFLPPLTISAAQQYWQAVNNELESNDKVIFIALQNAQILGSVQLSLINKENGQHRAEVEKLMVHKSARGQGVAKALMQTLETLALSKQRSLIVLDTRKGDIASHLYKKLGYVLGGEIPNFARNAAGNLESTVYFYKNIFPH